MQPDSCRFNDENTFEQVKGGYGIDLMIGYPGLWNKGLGSRTVRQMADYLIDTFGAAVVCADPEENNKRSVACWLKGGFVPLGKVENYDEPDKQSIVMAYRR
jgi:aminoglycoside 6'-N-acetyltransferase